MVVISAKNETFRIFKNDFLERMSHIHPATPIVGFTPIILWLFWKSFPLLSVGQFFGYFALGLFIWMNFEYILHRWIFHYDAKSTMGKRIMFLIHGVHHAYPQDATRLVIPLPVSYLLGIPFYLTFTFLFADGAAQAVTAGLFTGYVTYDCVHFAIHHWPMKNPIAAFWKKNHLHHHFSKDGRAYTILIPFWDYVFGTGMKK